MELLVLFLFSFFVYLNWFSYNNFVSSDWTYSSANNLSEFFKISIWTSFTGFGSINYSLWRFPLALVQDIFGKMNFSSSVADKYLFFILISVALPIVSYYFVKNITKNRWGGVAGSLICSYNTYFLSIDSQGHLAITVASVFLILVLIIVHWLEDTKKWEGVGMYYPILASFLAIIVGIYDLRVLYILLFILLFQYLFSVLTLNRESLYKKTLFYIIFFSTFVLLSLYWVLPFFLTKASSVGNVLDRPLWRSEIFSILRSFTIEHPFWNLSDFVWFKTSGIPIYLWLVTFMSFSSLLIFRRVKKVIFYGALFLLGILLSKQEAAPFVNLYSWLFKNLPGFNAFREASKFYILVIIGSSVLCGYLVTLIDNGNKDYIRKIGYLCLFLVFMVSIINTTPVINGNIGGIYNSVSKPVEYEGLEKYLSQSDQYFRTLWVPEMGLNWGLFNLKHPALNYYEVSGTLSDDTAPWDPFVKTLNKSESSGGILSVFNQSYFQDILSSSMIKYIILPLENKTDTKNPFRLEDKSKLIGSLDNVKWLKRTSFPDNSLIVYENAVVNPYIFSINKIIGLNSTDSNSLSFAKKINKNLFFIHSDSEKNNTYNILKLFDDSDFSALNSIRKTVINSTQKNKYYLYTNDYPALNRYSLDNLGRINVKNEQSGQVYLNNDVVSKSYTSKSSILNSDDLLTKDGQLFKAGDLLSSKKLLNKTNNVLEKIVLSDNEISNGSFENGLWNKDVADCDNYDKNGLLRMSINTVEKTDGMNSLQLEALRHIACTSINVPIPQSGDYVLSFDYQSPNAKSASFYIGFNNKDNVTIKDNITILDNKWNTYRKIVTIPKGVKSFSLYVYAISTDGKENVINRYDNFKFAKIESVQEVNSLQENVLEKKQIYLKEGGNVFEYNDGFDPKNNIIPNPSFETGAWNEKVGDCNNFDDNPLLNMYLDREVKSDGEQSLQLEATRHVACTNIVLNVTSGGMYQFSFDYQSSNADHASYYLGFNNKNKTVIEENLPIKDKNWNTFSKTVKVPEDATAVSLYVYTDSTGGNTNIINRYDNFKMTEVPDLSDAYYLVSDPGIKLNEPKSISFDLINPTKKLVHIKGATTPFYLAMSESYHPQWQLQFNNNKVNGLFNSWIPFVKPDLISDEYHYRLNDFLNAWYVDTRTYCSQNAALCIENADGSYDIEMVIEFFPQRWFYFGLLISGITLAGCLGYLGYEGVKRIKIKKKNEKDN